MLRLLASVSAPGTTFSSPRVRKEEVNACFHDLTSDAAVDVDVDVDVDADADDPCENIDLVEDHIVWHNDDDENNDSSLSLRLLLWLEIHQAWLLP